MTINGKSHDLARIDASVRLGTTEIWEIVSVGMAHPFHIHGASFRVLQQREAGASRRHCHYRLAAGSTLLQLVLMEE